MKPIALIKCGGTLPQTVFEHGDFEDWFAHGLGDVPIQQVDVFRGEAPWAPEGFSGVLVTGSIAFVSDRSDWSEATAQWLLKVINEGLPILGVCYGHQLLAHALGGRVGKNPLGRQIGTRRCELDSAAADDELMCQLPESFPVQTSHLEVVLDMPRDAVRLASTTQDPNFAIRFQPRVWGVQFHPEFSAAVIRDYITIRKSMLHEEGLEPDRLLAGVKETPVSWSLLSRFSSLVQGTPAWI